MTKWYLYRSGASRQEISLYNSPFASGAQGDVYYLKSDDHSVAKIYKSQDRLDEYSRKIDAMLADPPILAPAVSNGHTYVQIAWPSGKIHDGRGKFRGFTMPKIGLNVSTALENILQKASRR